MTVLGGEGRHGVCSQPGLEASVLPTGRPWGDNVDSKERRGWGLGAEYNCSKSVGEKEGMRCEFNGFDENNLICRHNCCTHVC